MAKIIWKRGQGSKYQVCSECGRGVPGPNKCCDQAYANSERAMQGAATRMENGYVLRSYSQRLKEGFAMMQAGE